VEKIVLGSVIYEKKNTQKLNKEQFSNKFSDKNENEFFFRGSQKNSCIVDSCIGVWTFSPNV
jgi:hypothetical protein